MAQRPLNKVHPSGDAGPRAPRQVDVAIEFVADRLEIGFRVAGGQPWVNAALPVGTSQFGLWDWDVVEIFLCTRAERSCYHEFQVSPLNQFFELKIFEPRKRFDREFRSGFTHAATPGQDGGWSASLSLPLAALNWDGRKESLVGNAFAIFGAPSERSYWSLFLPAQEIPDFHLPQHFAPLL